VDESPGGIPPLADSEAVKELPEGSSGILTVSDRREEVVVTRAASREVTLTPARNGCDHGQIMHELGMRLLTAPPHYDQKIHKNNMFITPLSTTVMSCVLLEESKIDSYQIVCVALYFRHGRKTLHVKIIQIIDHQNMSVLSLAIS